MADTKQYRNSEEFSTFGISITFQFQPIQKYDEILHKRAGVLACICLEAMRENLLEIRPVSWTYQVLKDAKAPSDSGETLSASCACACMHVQNRQGTEGNVLRLGVRCSANLLSFELKTKRERSLQPLSVRVCAACLSDAVPHRFRKPPVVC